MSVMDLDAIFSGADDRSSWAKRLGFTATALSAAVSGNIAVSERMVRGIAKLTERPPLEVLERFERASKRKYDRLRLLLRDNGRKVTP